MGLLGGSRVDGITVFLVMTLVVYTMLANGVVSTFADTEYKNPYENQVTDFELGVVFESSEVQNISEPEFVTSQALFEDLSPTGKLTWEGDLLGIGRLKVFRFGYDWWNGWISYPLNPYEGFTPSELIEDYNPNGNYTRKVFDFGGDLEVYVYFCPLYHYNDVTEEVNYIYDGLEDSFNNGEITVVMGTNATYQTNDIDDILGILNGFDTYDMPDIVGDIISTIFWALLIITIAKLVVG